MTTSFERARGKRGSASGPAATVRRRRVEDIAASAEQVFMAFVDPSQRAGWLPDVALSERTVSKPTSPDSTW